MLGKTKLQSLIEKSDSIVSVFEKTKNDIVKINDEITKEVSNKETVIENLKSEVKILNNQMIKNNNVLININKIFQ